jgi:hypothetical protein
MVCHRGTPEAQMNGSQRQWLAHLQLRGRELNFLNNGAFSWQHPVTKYA